MSARLPAAPARPSSGGGPLVTLGWVAAALAAVVLPAWHWGGSGEDAWRYPSIVLDITAVVIGLLAVTISVQTLDAREQPRANLFVFGLTVALVVNGCQVALALVAAGRFDGLQSFFLTVGHGAEVLTLLAFSLRSRLAGRGVAWLAAGLTVAFAWAAVGMVLIEGDTLERWPQRSLLGVHTAMLVAAAWIAHSTRTTRAQASGSRLRLVVAATWALAVAEGLLAYAGGLGAGWRGVALLAGALRVGGYVLLFQAIYISGVRLPYQRARDAEARMRDGELRLQLLGRNLPGTVLVQLVREADGRSRFLHISDAVQRLLGREAHELLRDPLLLSSHILSEDRSLYELALEHSFQTRAICECVVRMQRRDGQTLWVRLSASPRQLDGGRTVWDGVLVDVTEQRNAERLTRERDIQLAGVLQHLPGGVSRVDTSGRVVYMNPLQASWLRCAPAAMEGQFLFDILPKGVLAALREPLARAVRGEKSDAEVTLPGDAGRRDWSVTLVPEHNGMGNVDAVVIFAYDVTEQKSLAQALSQQRAQLAGLVSAIPDLVSLKDVHGRYLSGNPVFERFMGRPERALLGLTDAQLLPADQAARIRALDQRVMDAWQPLVIEETLTFAEDGYSGRFETVKTPMRDAQGRVSGVLSVSRDITDRQRAAQEIERLAFYDVLTGLPNRRLLLDRLQHALARCRRTPGQGAVLFIDLDNFKDLNDTLGHDMGDRLLAQVATRLQECVREYDTVARFGGDEFVVMLEGLGADEAQAALQAEQVGTHLLAALNKPFALAAQQYYSTPSIGVTLFGAERCGVEDLLKRADMAMYEAKAAGRNTMRFFDPQMQAALGARLQLESDLRAGLEHGHLQVHLQPLMDADAALVCGAEALVRWQHPQRGLLAPAQFIGLAEQTGLIVPLGRVVLQAACRQLARWAAHEETRTLTLAVNVSARQFRHPGFVQEVLDAAAEEGAPLERLKLELTETLLLGDVEDTVLRMTQLRERGVTFALDDFGTGYSSLGYLKRLPLSQIKIDQGFVRDVLTNPNDAAIVRTILALAHSLDLQVVAEGVETAGQLAFLRHHGCGGYQGWLFGRPCPVEQFEARYLPRRQGQATQQVESA